MKQILIHELGHANVYEALRYDSIITIVPAKSHYVTTFTSAPDVSDLEHMDNLLTAGIAGTVAEYLFGYDPLMSEDDFQQLFEGLEILARVNGESFPCSRYKDLMYDQRGLLSVYEDRAKGILIPRMHCMDRQAEELSDRLKKEDGFTVTFDDGMVVDTGADAVMRLMG